MSKRFVFKRNLVPAVLWLLIALTGPCAMADDKPDEPDKTDASAVASSSQQYKEPIPFKKDSVVSGNTLARASMVLLFGVILAIAAAYGVRRFVYGNSPVPNTSRRIRILETKRLSAKTLLFLIEVDGNEFLLSQVGDSLVVLDKRQGTSSEQE